MELELGLKITHNRDDITSHANLRIAKDYTGPLFLSKETESMFFIIAYLKGFVRENIDIDINKYGNRIAISGKRAVQEMVLSGWIMHKKDVELRAYRKVFQIPEGINLDRIKAKFNDKESSLTIVMPKLVKGMRGISIQEVNEAEESDQVTQSGQDKLPEGEYYKEPMEEIEESEIEREPKMPHSTEENFKEEAKEDIEPKIESKEGSDQVETTKAAAEVFPDNSKETMLKEKPEESEKEETERVVAEAEAKNERPVDMKLQEKPETEGGNESDEKVESPATNQETAAMEPGEVTKEGEIEQPEEKKPNPIEDFPEQLKKQDIPEAESLEEEKPEEHGNLQESNELTEAVRGEVPQQQEVQNLPTPIEQETGAMQELKEQETERKVQETKNPEADKEQFNKAETEQSKEQAKENEEKGQEESHDGIIGSEIQREANDEVKLPEEQQMEELEIKKQKETKNDKSKGYNYKLRPPFVVAGSALLVSLIVLVINLIRAKRR